MPNGLVALDPPNRHVYVIQHPTGKRPYAARAHQGERESIQAGVQWQYLAAHVCAAPKKKARKK